MAEALIEIVDTHLRGCLPPGVPPSYRQITRARWAEDRRKRRVIEADLVMFDGAFASVRVTEHRMLFGEVVRSHRFVMETAVFWEDGAWHRDDPGEFAWDTIRSGHPAQLEMFGAVA